MTRAGVEEAIRDFLSTQPPLISTLLLTIVSMVGGIGIVLIHDSLLHSKIYWSHIFIGAFIPVVLAPPMLYFLIRTTLELRAREKELSVIASRDDLTGLLNRRSVFERAEHLLNLATRHNRPLSLGMIDLDFFKSVNDTCGHQAGDEVLNQFASLLIRHLRSIDLLGRYGGEEFLLVMPETPLQDALVILKRLRRVLAKHQFNIKGLNQVITFSAGLACLNGKPTDLAELIEHADRALYVAKDSGRDRTALYSTRHRTKRSWTG